MRNTRSDKETLNHYHIDPEEEGVYNLAFYSKEFIDVALSEFVKNAANRQRTVIDYDEEYDEFVMRIYPMEYGGKEPEMRISDEERRNMTEPLRKMRTLKVGRSLRKEP